MTNKEAVFRLQEIDDPLLENLIWIAAHSPGRIDNFFKKAGPDFVKQYFPKCVNQRFFSHWRQELYDLGEYGVLAEFRIPELSNFRFENGEPVSWSRNWFQVTPVFIYGQDLEDVILQIERIWKERFAAAAEQAKHLLNTSGNGSATNEL